MCCKKRGSLSTPTASPRPARSRACSTTSTSARRARSRSTGRDFLQREFAALGLEYVPSHANFVLVKVGDGKAVFQALMKRGIIVRDMNAYGLPEWIRVSIGTPEQNERFLAELKKLSGLAIREPQAAA